MNISHWGIFPGYFVAGVAAAAADGYAKAMWQPIGWEARCAIHDKTTQEQRVSFVWIVPGTEL